MRQAMSLGSRRELIRATYERYQRARRKEKQAILDEFVASTGYHRKYAMEVLNHPPRLRPRTTKRNRRRKYGIVVQQTLVSLWKVGNCLCSKRLVALLPELVVALERHGELNLEEQMHLEGRTRELLLGMSAATMDRLLARERRSRQPHGKATTKPGTLLRRQIPVRTFAEWNEQQPGFVEVDLVAHCDDEGSGEFLHTLVLTDVHTGWTEYLPLANKGQRCTCEGIDRLRKRLPFPLLGLDSDNGSEFLNHHLLAYCKERKITFTRCRPYRKNDQCHVEQKNWSIIRRRVGYDRYEGEPALEALHSLYQALRLYENYFQPCMKLVGKERRSTPRGERTLKRYDTPKTPYQRVMECEQVDPQTKERLRQQYEQLNPKALLLEVQQLQRKLWDLAVVHRDVAVVRSPLLSSECPAA